MGSVNLQFRKANLKDQKKIWEILQQAIERRRLDGSEQWQDGYPNPETVKNDIVKGFGYVLEKDREIALYGAIILNDEPAYDEIVGKWLTDGDFVVVHRVAISNSFLGQGLVKKYFEYIEDFARENHVYSIKMDTNFDNAPMLHIVKKLGYQPTGKVYFRGGERLAFEKVLQP